MRELDWQPAPDVARIEDLDKLSQDRIAESIMNNFKNWGVLRQGYENTWRSIDRHVNQYDPIFTPLEKTEFATKLDDLGIMGSKLKMGNTYAHREGIVAAVMKFLMTNDYDFFDIVPLDPMEAEQTVAVKQYLMYLFDQMDFETDFMPFVRDIVHYGTAFASFEWRQESVTRWKTDYMYYPGVETPVRMTYKAQETIYNAPKFTPLNIYNTMIDPTCTNIRQATVIIKKRRTPHEILADASYVKMTPEEAFSLPDAIADRTSAYEFDREIARGNEYQTITAAYKGKKDVYEAWGDFTDNYTLYQNYVAEVIDGKLVRFDPNPYNIPYKPIITARYSVETDRVYGHPPLASIVATQSGFDTIVNQVIDANAMHNERPIILPDMVLVQDKNNKNQLPPMGKNVAWRVRTMAEQPARLKDDANTNVTTSIPILTLLAEQMKMVTGDNEMISGGSPDRYVKTGVAVQAADAGNAKFNLYAKTIEREGIIPVLELMVQLLRQRYSLLEPKTFKSTEGTQTDIQFEPVLLMNDMKFTLRGASYNATKQLQINAMQQFYTMIGQNQFIAPIMNWIRVIIDMGEALGIRNIRSQINPQAMMMLQQMPPTQAPWWMNVMNLFGNKQQNEQMKEMSLGQQYGNAISPAIGGPTSAGSPFDPTAIRGAANPQGP